MRLAILAKGETLKFFPKGNDTPFDEVWGLNQQAKDKSLSLDRLYVMDDLMYRMSIWTGPEFTEWLKTYPGKIITAKAYPDWPTAESYPIEDIAKHFGLPFGIAMYSTIDYMIAQAIYEQWDVMDLFGVDNISHGQHEMRNSTGMWIAAAMSRDITVNTSPGSYYQFWTNTGIAHEYGLYGYHFRPRIENLVRR